MITTSGLFALLAPRKEEVLAGAVARLQMGGAARPTVDHVKDAALFVAKDMALAIVGPQCKAVLDQAVMMFPLVYGAKPEGDYNSEAAVAWRDAFDTHIMDAIGIDALRLAGQDFIGSYITDSEIDEDAVRETAAKEMAGNIVQSSIGERTPGQVLAEIGIVAEDLARFGVSAAPVAASANAPAAAVIAEPLARAHVERLVGTWAIGLGVANFSLDAATELLKGAFDDDPFLPLEYIKRLGGQDGDAPYFASYFRAAGKDAIAATANAAFMAALTGQLVEMPAGTPKGRKGRKSAAAAAPSAAAVAPPPPPALPTSSPGAASRAGEKEDIADVIKLLRQHASDGAEAVGGMVGKSRATIKNIEDGKTTCKVDAATKAKLLAHVQMRIQGLQLAASRLG